MKTEKQPILPLLILLFFPCLGAIISKSPEQRLGSYDLSTLKPNQLSWEVVSNLPQHDEISVGLDDTLLVQLQSKISFIHEVPSLKIVSVVPICEGRVFLRSRNEIFCMKQDQNLYFLQQNEWILSKEALYKEVTIDQQGIQESILCSSCTKQSTKETELPKFNFTVDLQGNLNLVTSSLNGEDFREYTLPITCKLVQTTSNGYVYGIGSHDNKLYRLKMPNIVYSLKSGIGPITLARNNGIGSVNLGRFLVPEENDLGFGYIEQGETKLCSVSSDSSLTENKNQGFQIDECKWKPIHRYLDKLCFLNLKSKRYLALQKLQNGDLRYIVQSMNCEKDKQWELLEL